MALVVGYVGFMRWIHRAIEVADRQKLTQRRIADAAGVEPARITRWKNGQGEVTLRQAAKVAELLGVSLDWLVADDVETGAAAPATGIDRDSDMILRVVRSLELTPAEAVRRLATGGPGPRPEQGRVLASQWTDPSRLGETGGDPLAAEPDDVPRRRKPTVRKR